MGRTATMVTAIMNSWEYERKSNPKIPEMSAPAMQNVITNLYRAASADWKTSDTGKYDKLQLFAQVYEKNGQPVALAFAVLGYIAENKDNDWFNIEIPRAVQNTLAAARRK